MPMEDIGVILINSFSALLHGSVFLEATRCGTVVILCENFRPACLLLPANRATDTILTRAQFSLSAKQRQAFWGKTITAKCANQATLANTLEPELRQSLRLIHAAASPRAEKESACARLYWGALSRHLNLARFLRKRDDSGLNSLLNYGYAVLLARVLQKMLACGLDPTFGIGHMVRERATPLAYDLMEPFRPVIDARIVAWVKSSGKEKDNNAETAEALEVTKEYKRWVQGSMDMILPYAGKSMTLEHVMEYVIQGFRQALVAKRLGLYRPWTLRDTKWDGCS